MAAERHWRPRLFLMQISDGMDKETYHHNPSAPIELELFGPTVSYGQKNWMHIPSEMEADLDLLFIYKIVPLCVVKTNPITGQTMIEYEAAQSISSSPYKGSSGMKVR